MKKKLFILSIGLCLISISVNSQIKIHSSGGISIGSETDPGNLISFDKQTIFNASISNLPSSLVPATTDLYDLGSSTLAWKGLYVNDISVSNGFPDIVPTTSGNNLGGATLKWKLYASDIDLSSTFLTGTSYYFKINPSSGGYLMITPSPGSDMSFNTDKDLYVFDEEVYALDFTTYSDITLKENVVKINELGSSLEKLSVLEGIQYNLIADTDKATRVGFSAQEVQKVIPEVVHEDHEGKLAISYSGLIPYLVEALKEQEARIDEMEKQLDEYKKTISTQ